MKERDSVLHNSEKKGKVLCRGVESFHRQSSDWPWPMAVHVHLHTSLSFDNNGNADTVKGAVERNECTVCQKYIYWQIRQRKCITV